MLAKLIRRCIDLVSTARDLPPLLFRLILAYGFYYPARHKIEHFDDTIASFGRLGIPFPELNAYLATAAEAMGTLLLLFGLGTHFIAIPLMVVMIVAIETVHLKNGFGCDAGGFEINLYFLLMLFSLMVTGAGRISIDGLIARRFGQNRS